MSQIRPVSDLRNKFAQIAREVESSTEGVILTKNGYPNMVVVSYESHTRRKFEEEVYQKLMDAELQSRTAAPKLTHEEVFTGLRDRMKARMDEKHV